MEKDFYIQLLEKQLVGDLSAAERIQLDAWLSQSADNQKTARFITKAWDASSNFSEEVDIDLEENYAAIQKRLRIQKSSAKITSIYRKSWWGVAATIAILIVAGLWWFNTSIPGIAARLLTANTTANTQTVELADGTVVTLNKNSTLSYPAVFETDRRQVKLIGEAFFEVAHNEDQPFIITLINSEVQVLGTTFNVRNYKVDKAVKVSVQSGKVRFSNQNNEVILTANETGILDKETQNLTEQEDKNLNDLAWNTQRLVFKSTPLQEVLTILQKHYGVAISIENQAMLNCPLSNVFNNKSIQATLENITSVYGMTLTKVDQKYVLRGGNCS